MNARHHAMRDVIVQLHSEKRLRAGLTVDRATDILWSLVNPLHYANLVQARGWSGADYAAHLETMARAALFGEAPGPWRKRTAARGRP